MRKRKEKANRGNSRATLLMRGYQNPVDFDIIANIRNKAVLRHSNGGTASIGSKLIASQISSTERIRIIEIDGTPVSYVFVTKDGTREGKTWQFTGPSCLPEYGNKLGIDMKLLEWLINYAKESGITTLIRHIRESRLQEHVKELLKGEGFREEGGYFHIRLELTGQHVTTRTFPDELEMVDYHGDEDFDDLWIVIKAAFGHDEDDYRTIDELKGFLGSSLKSGYVRICFDTTSKRPVGVIAAVEMRGSGDKIGFIGTFGVIPSFQGRGIGSLLMESTIAHFWQAGIDRIETVVKIENKIAFEIYKHLGFQIIPDRTIIALKKDI
ncbi:MAG: GNAT family N-acetyltransferase [Candidatus Hodarchaeales archaeon]